MCFTRRCDQFSTSCSITSAEHPLYLTFRPRNMSAMSLFEGLSSVDSVRFDRLTYVMPRRLRRGIGGDQDPRGLGKRELHLTLYCHQRLGAEQGQPFLCGSKGTCSGNCQEAETCMARHVARHGSLSKTILQGTLGVGRHRGQQRKCWVDNIKKWTSAPMPELLTRVSCGKDWKRISAEWSL